MPKNTGSRTVDQAFRHFAPNVVRAGLGAIAAPAVLRVDPGQRPEPGHQDRPRQPEDRSARRLRRGRRFHPRAGPRHSARRACRAADAPTRSRSSARTASRTATAPPRSPPSSSSATRSTSSSRRRRPTPPIRSPIRPRSTRCPASPPIARGSRISSAARAIRPRASPGPIISSGASRTSSARSSRCGIGAPTNKVVGGLFPNDADGNAWGDPQLGLPPALAKAGYKLTDPGRYQLMNNDFTSQISAFKASGAEIVTGNMIPPDFATFWSQAAQQGFRPKIVTIGKALLFPSVIEFARRARQRPHHRDLVDAEPSVQVRPHRPEREGADRRLCRAPPSGRGRSRSASSTRCSRWRSTCSSAPRRCEPKAILEADRRDRLQVDRRAGELDRPAGEERHQDAARRRPVAAQGRQVRPRHHHQQDRAEIPVGGKLQLLS